MKEEIALVRKMCHKGDTDLAIAKALKRSKESVKSLRKKHKIKRPSKEKWLAFAGELYDSGKTVQQIAAMLSKPGLQHTHDQVRKNLRTRGHIHGAPEKDMFRLKRPWPSGLCYRCGVNDANHRCGAGSHGDILGCMGNVPAGARQSSRPHDGAASLGENQRGA